MQTPRALATALFALATAAWCVGARAADGPERFLGKVKKADKEGPIEVRHSSGTAMVEVPSGARLERLDPANLHSVPEDLEVHALGRRQEEQRDPNTQATVPPQIVNVQTVVLGAGFTPPAITEEQKNLKLAWYSGKLKRQGSLLKVDETLLQFGKGRSAWHLGPAEAKDARKRNAILLVAGTAEGDKVTATSVLIIDRRVPAGEVKAILGL